MTVAVHNHSHFSSLDGWSKPSEIADRIEEIGLAGAFITDHGTVAGFNAFREAMTWKNKKKGIKRDLFIGYGMEAYQARTSRKITRVFDEDKGADRAFKKGEDSFHLILLAKNAEGLLNLRRISDEAGRTGTYYDPRVDWELLEKYREGLIATTACLGSLVCKRLAEDDLTPLYKFIEIFGDDLFVELNTYDHGYQEEVNKRLVSIARERGIPLLYANDAHYTKPEEYEYHEALIDAQYNMGIEEPHQRSNHPTDNTKLHPQCLYIMGEDEVRQRLAYLGDDVVNEAIGNSDWLMDVCKVEFPKYKMHLPKFPLPEGVDSKEHFIDLVEQGIEKKYPGAGDDLYDRAEFEMRAFFDAGIHDYFLIQRDTTNWALDHGIMVGPGRGSVGGSLVANVLDITNIDPIKYGLQFERFWNPGRAKGMPDIDTDYANYGRDSVINMVEKKYGDEYVLHIGNHIFFRPRSAIDKAAMVLYKGNEPHSDIKKIKKIIESTTDAGQQKSWDDMWDTLGEWAEAEGKEHPLMEYAEKYPDMFDFAQALDGRISSYGVHASGVIVSDEPLADYLPARVSTDDDKNRVVCSQAEMWEVDAEGFMKLDFLGLRNLDACMITAGLSGEFCEPEVIMTAVEKLRNRDHHLLEAVELDALRNITQHFRSGVNYNHLPDSCWELCDKGLTLGLFQIEDGGSARRIAREIRPRSVEDLAAIVALNRPGPLRGNVVDRFLKRRKGEEEVSYPHPILEPILEATYGDFLYQEQVIAYFKAIGYDLSEADHIRKILGKKLTEEMQAEFPRYMERAQQHMSKAVAERIWKLIEEFSKYSFNKAHAVGYGIILAWTMYAKWKWRTEFVLAQIMTCPQHKKAERIPAYITEARRMDIKVLPPDINRSKETIWRDGDDIIYGLSDIKGVKSAAKWIVEHQPYASIEDFEAKCIKADGKSAVNVGVRQKIIDAGACDGFGYRMTTCIDCAGKGRLRLDPTKRLLDDCPECGGTGRMQTYIPEDDTRMNQQIELLGIPLGSFNTALLEKHGERIEKLDYPDVIDEVDGDETLYIVGTVANVKVTKTGPKSRKPGSEMAILTVEWEGRQGSFAVFPDDWANYRQMFWNDQTNKPILRTTWEFKLSAKPGSAFMKRGTRFDE